MKKSSRPRLRPVYLLAISILVTMGALSVIRPALAASPVRVMALGDSITGSPGCWRALLWQHLQNTGFTNVDFVGTLPAPGCGFTYDGDNEGHGGFLATQIVSNNQLPGWLSATHPDIVMMHLGTNDVWNHLSSSTILNAYTSLLGQMRASNPRIRLLVAQILPMNPAGCADCPSGVIALDNAIPGWAAAHTTAQSPITVVDQFSGFNDAADTVDGVHPNSTTGIQKVAAKWYAPLTSAINAVGGPASGGPTPTGGQLLVGVQSGRCIELPNSSQTDGARIALHDCNGGANQRWSSNAAGELRVFGSRCLDAFGRQTTPGTIVEIWDCTGGPNQKWTINSDGTIRGVQSGLCLDVSGQATANGSAITLWTCNGQNNQKWTLR